GQERSAQLEQLLHARVRDEVEDSSVAASRSDKTAPAQTRKVIGDPRLAHGEPDRKLADRQLALVAEKTEHSQPRRIGKRSKVLRDEISRRRRGRKLEGSRSKRTTHARCSITLR